MRSVIVIPSRHASTRFPGKPLAEIAGKSMVRRVWEIADYAADKVGDVDVIVATDDQRIIDHVEKFGGKAVMTSDECRTGSDRVRETVQQLDYKPDFAFSFQGDAPLTPPWVLIQMLEEARRAKGVDVVTPVFQLSWDQLDELRAQKKITPFSGTTVILNDNNDCVWFSKKILPAMRNEEKDRENLEKSPVFRHPGMYCYSYDTLMNYSKMDSGHYEVFEGLEQLRVLENGRKIRAVIIEYKDVPQMSGVDTPEDLARCEELIQTYCEPLESKFLEECTEKVA